MIFLLRTKIKWNFTETLVHQNHRFIIIGIGVNLVKSPKILKYPTTYLFKFTKKRLVLTLFIMLLKRTLKKIFNLW